MENTELDIFILVLVSEWLILSLVVSILKRVKIQ